MKKKILFVLIIIFVAIQFIRPAKNISTAVNTTGITKQYTISDTVEAILQKACYDCHSNNTVYPWYAQVQPVGWWMNGHINDAKDNLNFSEFSSYPVARQYRKLEDAIKEVKDGGMPIFSYTIIHTNARLSEVEKKEVCQWFADIRRSMQSKYPPDSLINRDRKEF